MTLKDLNKYFALVAQFDRIQETICSLRALAEAQSPKLTGMPHGAGVKDKVGDLAVEITENEKKARAMLSRINSYRTEIEAFIDGVSDAYIQTILRLRFLRCLKWDEVARVVGGGNSADSVKKTCYRDLKELVP